MTQPTPPTRTTRYLTAEQEIRAQAIDTAAHLDGGDTWHSSPQALVRDLAAVADLIAAYIADGSTP